MAKFHFSTLILISFIFITTISTAKSHSFVQTISPTTLGLHKPQKLSHIRFYFHDIIGGKNQTAIRVASSPASDKSPTGFGSVMMMDDPLTAKPELDSQIVGRAQGIYASASQSELGFLMVLNFVFTQGKYNGSSLSVLGRNTVESAVREMPIVGGSGLFRFARGYAHASTHSIITLEAVVEYNVYVFHY
ncbi:disease resistance response protein [Trifolium pratense]|uniref:Dirigent protein n=1 Tax=Trifolium pratense TaxID=57577 RepID=A0A2K3N744_TRIPR|nr:dirigent protein 22-like [Trifolium pratense]PNX98877.1 disease resistance response protein [Trifolium pratense]